MFHRGGWGTVCDNSAVNSAASIPAFSVGAAAVACRQLGFQEGFEIQALVCPYSHCPRIGRVCVMSEKVLIREKSYLQVDRIVGRISS